MKYSEAGVSIDAQNDSNERIKKHVRSTHTEHVVTDVGHFAGSVKLPSNLSDPVLIMSTDGVGTKTIIAEQLGRFESLGADIVHNCGNDVLAVGAEPKYFTDYVASAQLKPEVVEEIVKGIAEACKNLGIVLMGGETAEMPGVYRESRHDLVGTMVGIAERSMLFDSSQIKEGDAIIGLPSNGVHTNGYSLVRKIVEARGLDLTIDYDMGMSLGELLLLPHRDYVKDIMGLRQYVTIRGLAHITGGGITENVPRMFPEGLGAAINLGGWKIPLLFQFIQQQGDVSQEEMLRTFNCGVGMVLVVPKEEKNNVLSRIESYDLGTVVVGKGVTYTNY